LTVTKVDGQRSYGTARHEVARWYDRVGLRGLERLLAMIRGGSDFQAAYDLQEASSHHAPWIGRDLRGEGRIGDLLLPQWEVAEAERVRLNDLVASRRSSASCLSGIARTSSPPSWVAIRALIRPTGKGARTSP
jgi:hypothetical protein